MTETPAAGCAGWVAKISGGVRSTVLVIGLALGAELGVDKSRLELVVERTGVLINALDAYLLQTH